VTVTKAEYERGRTTLTEAGFSEDLISRLLNKPKRAYTKDSNWKTEAKTIYAETGVITRSQIMSTKGFPASSNLSQKVKRFISWLQNETGDTLTHDKKSDYWSVQADLSEHFESLGKLVKEAPNLWLPIPRFNAFCEEKGVPVDVMRSGMRGKFSYVANRGVTSV
jgi:hypothetical protein